MLQEISELVESGGYLAIAALMFAENVFPPIPSEIVLPLAGYEVTRGSLGFLATVAAATLGSLLGAYVLYAIGRFGGRPVVLRWGRVLRVGAADLDRSEGWFRRWGDWVVLGGRVVPLARSLVSIPAGTLRMPVVRFTVLTTAGSLVWNLVLIGAGYALGRRWEQVAEVVGRYSDVAAVLVVVAIAAGIAFLLRRRSRRAAP